MSVLVFLHDDCADWERSMGGLRVTPDVGLADVAADAIDALILPGGTFWRDFRSEPLRDRVTGLLERGAPGSGRRLLSLTAPGC